MPLASPPPRWRAYLVALAAACVMVVAGADAIGWYGHPIGGVFVMSSRMIVSGVGVPTWDGVRQGLRFPDRIVEIDGEDLEAADDAPRVWDDAIVRAAAARRPTVHVRVRGTSEARELDLRVEPFVGLAWWVIAGIPILIGGLYSLVAVTALMVRPDGALARSMAKATFFAALFLFAYCDFHTTRRLTALEDLGMLMVPVGFGIVALRLPDDVPLLVRYPWIERALEVAALFGAVGLHFGDQHSAVPRAIASAFFGAAQFFFVATIVVRFVRARGERRATLRSLLGAMLIAHVPVGTVVMLSLGRTGGSSVATMILPALALSPVATVLAFVRHDIWGSGGILSRVATRVTVGTVTCAVSIAIAVMFAVSMGVPFRGALIAASTAAIAAALLVTGALAASDRGIFASRADYKPTIEQLSEELTDVTMPNEVAAAVERTVRRWLVCKRVDFIPTPTPGFSADAPLEGVPGAKDLAIPVRFRGTVLGVLSVGEKTGGALFTSEDVDLLRTIANQAALALAHAHAYAELEARRRQQVAAWRDERAALVETLAAEIAHEVRYPINYFRSLFRRGPSALDQDEVEIGSEEVDRLERLVAGLRRVAEHRLEKRSVPIAEIASRAETLLRDDLRGRTLDIALPPDLALRCDPDQVTQIVVNLVANALEATQPSQSVGMKWTRVAGGGELTVWDRGAGFTCEASQLFAPWFTTKPRGTGLGLAITHRLVRAHGWTIDAFRREGATHFVIAIPTSDIVEPREIQESEVA